MYLCLPTLNTSIVSYSPWSSSQGPELPLYCLIYYFPTGHIKITKHTKTGEKELVHLFVPGKVSMNWI